MAGRGPAGKEQHTRTRNDPDFVELAVDGRVFGPELPEGVLPDGEMWHPQTVAFWESLRRSPQMEHEPELGWQFLIDTALMHHTMWAKGKWEFASEVRLRVSKYGATPEDRMRLKIKVQVPGQSSGAGSQAQSARVTSINSRRDRLTS